MCDIPESQSYSLTHMQCNQLCERREGSTVWMFDSGYAQAFFPTALWFLPLGKARHLPKLIMEFQRGDTHSQFFFYLHLRFQKAGMLCKKYKQSAVICSVPEPM